MRTVYTYNSQGYFLKTVQQNLDELSCKYPTLINATTTTIHDYISALEIPKFINDAWTLEDLKESGVFYLKTDATEFAEIVKKDVDLYTQIEPLQKYNDSTTQAFNDAAETWEYTFKGSDLLEAERLKSLNESKKVKFAQLEIDFNKSKKITIQNGATLVIAYNTPERDIFLKMIEDVSNLGSTEGTAFIYEQQTDVGKLALRILPEIAAYIFKDLFIATLSNPQKTKVNVRVHNKTTVYELALEKINKATTQTELDAVKWSFLNQKGIVIDVNAKANKMLADHTVSDLAKAAINIAKDPTTGEIHLVKTLQELADDS
tara:strand:- start:2813 stop:3766 length:954 start_codon:yes stop_codon:yes gene_type:complete